MIFKQVYFKDLLEEESEPCGGIAVYEDFQQGKDCPFLELKGVICGECGNWVEADDVSIIVESDTWWSISSAIEENVIPPKPEDKDDVDETGFNPYMGAYDFDC